MTDHSTQVVLFDDGLSRFGPLSDLRASFEQRLGAMTGLERARVVLGRVDAIYPLDHLQALCTERHGPSGLAVSQLPAGSGDVILINGTLESLEDVATLGANAVRTTPDGRLALARLARPDAQRVLERISNWERVLTTVQRAPLSHGHLVAAPWDLLNRLERSLPADIALLSRSGEWGDRNTPGVHRFGHHGVFVDPTAKVLPGAVIDTTDGPVLLAAGAVIRPGAVVTGPVAVLDHATIVDRAQVKARSVIGPWCKVGGEVGSVVLQAYSNKAHEGHLGDAMVGEWVNIGAGTCNSNLLNTYSEVSTRLDAAGNTERSGRAFYGGVIADHAKIAILVALNTGSTVGTGAMIAVGHPPTFVPRFAWMTPERTQPHRFGRFEETLRASMQRRGRAPGLAYLARLRDLHAAHASSATSA
jgi:UDP-N-acetylglucosamine diphosphorylase/glucosamine-1-phosphate N-acetyltransferase